MINIEKLERITIFRMDDKEDPSLRRFAILSYMLDLREGDVVVVPKMPKWDQFTIARVSRGYEFDVDENREDHRHIVHIESEGVRAFNYKASSDAFLVHVCLREQNIVLPFRSVTIPNKLVRALVY